MKERPALFSTPMVQAILADLKDITRRTKGLELINTSPNSVKFIGELHPNYKQKPQPVFRFKTLPDSLASEYIDIQCPYGQPGDILWVRETFYAYGYWSLLDGKWTFNDDTMQYEGYRYMDSPPCEINEHRNDGIGWYKRPSIFIPREACRLKLKIVSIRVERLHDITEEDAKREGVLAQRIVWMAHPLKPKSKPKWQAGMMECSHKEAFQYLWYDINGQESWDSNPWVWRIEFTVLPQPPQI